MLLHWPFINQQLVLLMPLSRGRKVCLLYFIFFLKIKLGMDNATRISTIEKAHAAGAFITVSLGGSNDQRWETTDAKSLATTVCWSSSPSPSSPPPPSPSSPSSCRCCV